MKSSSKVCYILSYKTPNYVRTTALVNALALIPEIKLFQARNKSKGILRYVETFLKFLQIRFKENPDVYIIGFRGHEMYWLYRVFVLRKIFVFDEMMSPYDSIVNERKILSKSNLIAKIIYKLEKSILQNSNLVLTDTNIHSKFFSKTFEIDLKKIKVIPVGTDEKLFDMKMVEQIDLGKDFTVFFYGTFLPLHGIDIVLRAASLLKKYPIKFVIVGGRGNERAIKNFNSQMEELELENVTHYDWVDFTDLPRYIKSSDLCLGGPFGGTPQARRVVTGKTYQFLHMGKATVIGKIGEGFGFVDKENCLLVNQNNENDLAEAILWGYENRERLVEIGWNGKILFEKRFSYKEISKTLKLFLK